MKFTSENLIKAMGLNVGDRVKIADDIYKLYLTDLGNYYLNCTKYDEKMEMYSTKDIELIDLLDKDIEILPRPKRVGDLKCDDFECTNCPLKYICCLCDWGFKTNNNLFNILELFNCYDQEIYDLLKARLDKVVE